jgi:hypothetical protein
MRMKKNRRFFAGRNRCKALRKNVKRRRMARTSDARRAGREGVGRSSGVGSFKKDI